MIASFLLILLGTASVFYSFYRFKRSNYLKKHGIAVDATVVKTEVIDESYDYGGDIFGGGINHYITFSYVIDGVAYRIRFNTDDAGKEPKYFVDETVRIYCDKDNPEELITCRDKSSAYVNVFYIIFGVILIAYGIYRIVNNAF